jgi:hypothetical protein
VSIRDLDDEVKERFRIRAAQHGRSMEAKNRAILAAAVSEPATWQELFGKLLDRSPTAAGWSSTCHRGDSDSGRRPKSMSVWTLRQLSDPTAYPRTDAQTTAPSGALADGDARGPIVRHF